MQMWAMYILAGTGLYAWRRPYINLLGCTCALVPPDRAWGHPEAPKPDRLRAPGTRVIGGASRGKRVDTSYATLFPPL